MPMPVLPLQAESRLIKSWAHLPALRPRWVEDPGQRGWKMLASCGYPAACRTLYRVVGLMPKAG